MRPSITMMKIMIMIKKTVMKTITITITIMIMMILICENANDDDNHDDNDHERSRHSWGFRATLTTLGVGILATDFVSNLHFLRLTSAFALIAAAGGCQDGRFWRQLPPEPSVLALAHTCRQNRAFRRPPCSRIDCSGASCRRVL